MKITKLLILLVLLFSFSCKEEEPEQIKNPERQVCATGELNGEEWRGCSSSVSEDDDFFHFGLLEKSNQQGCPFHEFSFRNIPQKIGNYSLMDYPGTQPLDNTVLSILFMICGDAVYADFNIDPDSVAFFKITSIETNQVKGSFQASFVQGFASDSTIPERLDYKNVEFEF